MVISRLKSREVLFSFRGLIVLILLPFFTACSTIHKLPSTPNIYAHANYPADSILPEEQGTTSKIYYITDRQPQLKNGELYSYDKQRSASMVFGEAMISYDEDLSWDELTQISQTQVNRPAVKVGIDSLDEVSRFPPTPLVFSMTPEGIKVDPDQQASYDQSTVAMKDAISKRLATSKKKDVILYIHGFNNSFEDAVLDINDVWHFSGRHGVPIAYTWPSGDGNLLGYFTDRESGEYTVYHLKETVRILSSMPEVENINVLAHSRGTDITTTALRELVIEARAAGKNPQETLKIRNLMLAAPDLDYGVVTQRLIAEKFGPAFGKITIYMNEDDSALGIAQTLMKGIRFGKLIAQKQTDREAQIFQNIRNVCFVNVKGVKGFLGHAYFKNHPGALSDIIRLITLDAEPGSAERPLTRIESNFWSLDRNYLQTDINYLQTDIPQPDMTQPQTDMAEPQLISQGLQLTSWRAKTDG